MNINEDAFPNCGNYITVKNCKFFAQEREEEAEIIEEELEEVRETGRKIYF